jgi:Arc/MetJ family transcription regulator
MAQALSGQIVDCLSSRAWFDYNRLRTDMRTTIETDDDLMRQAMRACGARTKRAAVEEGLRLLIRTRGQASVRRLRGKIAWRGDLESSRIGRGGK